MIPRYSLPEMAVAFHRCRPDGGLARSRARRSGRLGIGRSGADGGSRARPVTRTADARRNSFQMWPSDEAVTDHDLAAFVDVVQDCDRGPRGIVGALRAHLF